MNKVGTRVVALLLTGVMTLFLAGCGGKAGAYGGSGGAQSGALKGETVDFEQAGVSFTRPASWDADGILISGDGEELEKGVTIAYVQMFAYSGEEIGALQAQYADDYDAYVEKLFARKYDMFTVFGIDGGRGEKELKEIAEAVTGESFKLMKLGEADGWAFYSMTEAKKAPEPPAAKKALVEKALEDIPAVLESMRFHKPVPAPVAQIGDVISFETTDLNGESVSSEVLFAENKITMINLWVSWWGPCAEELPALETLNGRLRERGCGVIGIQLDADNPDALAKGIDIVTDAGVTYTILKPFDGVEDMLPAQEYPTAYFVDSEGRILGAPVIGADIGECESAIGDMLSRME